MRSVAFFASEPQYLEHITPIWEALPPERRAWFSVVGTATRWRAEQLGVDVQLERQNKIRRHGDEPCVVAGFYDLRKIGKRPAIFVEHGAGQTYPIGASGHPNYSGGSKRTQVKLFLCPNQLVAERNRAAYPHIPSVVVGCPKLARLVDIVRARERPLDRMSVAFSFHFNAPVAPETEWAFPHWKDAIARLVAFSDWNVLGHGHPRAMPHLRGFWRSLGVPVLESFDQVAGQADLYACDNSSTIFEAAALGIPTLMLNAPHYRRNVDQGLRFWEAARFLPMVDEPEDLERALMETRWLSATKMRACAEWVYGANGENAAQLAAAAILAAVDDDD
jgi:hypothetical protein